MVTSTKGETRAAVLFTIYTNMLRLAGGIPLILAPGAIDDVEDTVAQLDGLVLSGGGDVVPARYGGAIDQTVYGLDPLRDEYEIALARAARNAGLPTLAICRGLQVVNVAFGGTLIEDIASNDRSAVPHRVTGAGSSEPQHAVALDPKSSLASAIGLASLQVNSIHHQAIRDVGEGLHVVGTAPDGIIEAVESSDPDWTMWGVQWHPEYLGPDDGPSVAIFRAFVGIASRIGADHDL
jgi:putative glutamine amidotransferase